MFFHSMFPLFNVQMASGKLAKSSMMKKRKYAGLSLAAIGLLFPFAGHSQYKILGPGSCGLAQNNCHAEENKWWKTDAHKQTMDRFFDDAETCEKYAELSGVGAAKMLNGGSGCMQCHGTAVSGKENSEVEEGVSCESCHGPGSGYKDPHTEGDPQLGLERPGYKKGLQLGMMELKDLSVRAKTCVKCHYITDQKLIGAGHSNGAKFNYVSGIRKISGTPNHWKRAPGGEDLARAPFDNALKARGGAVSSPSPPSARVITALPEKGTIPKTREEAPGRSQSSSADAAATRPMKTIVKPPPPPPTPPAPPTAAEPIDLPPFPAIHDSASVAEILLIVKQRLELLYRQTGN